MELSWSELLNDEKRLVGAQLMVHEGLATHCGSIERIERQNGHVDFILEWRAHLTHLGETERDPTWIALATGKKYRVKLSWPLRMIDQFQFNFSIPNGPSNDGEGFGTINLPGGTDRIDPHIVRGLNLESSGMIPTEPKNSAAT